MKGLNGWVRLLEGNETAVLSSLIEELVRITDSRESSGTQLAEAILKDASLTTNIIRIANSAQYNPGDIPVTTVSRAILNIGFKNIRSVCMALKVLDTVLEESPSPLLVATLAKSLHAASQSKSLCSHLNHTEQEEIYVASMLSNLTELLVLGTNEEDSTNLKKESVVELTLAEKNKIAERTLGVSLTRLSKTLMKQWRIEGKVNDVLAEHAEPGSPIEAIILGGEISRASLFGWDSPEFFDVMRRVAEFKEITEKEAKKLIQETADSTADTVKNYGKAVLKGQIPTSKDKQSVLARREKSETPVKLLLPNQQLQLKALQELTTMMMSPFNINSVFKMILKGLHQGVGLERNVVAIFDKSNGVVRAKYALGNGTENWLDTFEVKYIKSHSGFLFNLFEHELPVWTGNEDYRAINQYLTPEYKGITGAEEFFIAPLIAKGRRVGVVYSDMGQSKRPLTHDYFGGFNHFVQQTTLALGVMAKKQKG